jgi:hypothetical protein
MDIESINCVDVVYIDSELSRTDTKLSILIRNEAMMTGVEAGNKLCIEAL